jgi:hypothetical protein
VPAARTSENHLAKPGASTHAPGFPEANWFKLCGQGHLVQGGIVAGFGLGRRDIADGLEKAAMIEPVHPFEGGEFHGLGMTPRSPAVDHLSLEQAVDGFSEGIVIGIAYASD